MTQAGCFVGFMLGHFLFEVSVFSVLEDVATCVFFCLVLEKEMILMSKGRIGQVLCQ